MKNKKIWIAIALIAFVVVAGSYAQQAAAAFAKVTVDFQLNTKAEDVKNKFNWTADSLKVVDKFDPKKTATQDGVTVTGASVAASTTQFDKVRLDATGKKTLPTAVRGLFLYAVSSYKTLQDDKLEVILVNPDPKAKDNTLVIRYFHRGVAYYIKTDKTGTIDIEKDAKLLEVGENMAGAFVVKAEYLKDGATDNTKWENADWAKIEPKLVADVADPASTVKYAGKLVAQFTAKTNALVIKSDKAAITLKK
jgi:hypothetical protein